MAKDVRWVVPFQSLKGIDYEIRIYDSYTGTKPASWPITLQPGETPFLTSEDTSDDFFAPIRTSTGTIQVVDYDGTLMEDIVPTNNISRPVKLVRINRSVTPSTDVAVEWQGFLSCEAYNQDYTAVAQVLDLNIISVLEAMDSVEFDVSFGGIKRVRDVIKKAIDTIETLTGMSNTYTNILFSASGYNFMSKYIDVASLCNVKEQSNQGNTTYTLYGISCKEVISNICKFMGWYAREQGQKLYLQQIACEYAMKSVAFDDMTLEDYYFNRAISHVDMDIIVLTDDLVFRGIGHTKTIHQGAKSVDIVANLADYDCEVDVPQAVPPEDIRTANRTLIADDDKSVHVYASMNTSFDSRYTFRRFFMDEGQGETPWIKEEGTNVNVFNNSWVGNRSESQLIGTNDYVGGLMCQVKDDNNEYDQSGLLVTAIHSDTYETEFLRDLSRYVVKCRSVRHLSASSGSIKIKLDYLLINRGNSKLEEYDGIGDQIKVVIKWGSKSVIYSDGNYSFGVGTNLVTLENTNTEITVPITSFNTGEIELYILPTQIRRWTTNQQYADYFEYIIKSLSVKYEPKSIIGEDRDANHYFKLLERNFSNEVSVDLNFASNLHNVTSPSHIFDDMTTPLTSLTYYDGFDYEQAIQYTMRPELNLMYRFVGYYSFKRRILELETEHITTKALSLLNLRLTPLEEWEGGMYLLLSEERDWQKDISKLTCFETIDYGE